MSDPKKNIPLSQLLNQTNQIQSNDNSRLPSIRTMQPQQPKLQFAPNINSGQQKSTKEKEEKTKLKVKKEQPKIKKQQIKRTEREFKPKPALFGEGGFGFGNFDTNVIEKHKKTEKVETNENEEKPNTIMNEDIDIDPCNPNHPITLPLKDPEEKYQEEKENINIIDKEKTYYTPLETIEENPRHINYPLHGGDGLLYGEYIMMQIPSLLPIKKSKHNEEHNETVKNDKKSNNENDDENTNAKKLENPLKGMSGYIGKIQIRKSGIATIKIGGITYQLTKGAKPHFLEEATVVDYEKQSMYRLGSISQHVIMTPELEEVFNSLL